MRWQRSPLATEDVVAALDATDTDAQAAERLGCSPRTVVALATRREEVRIARARQFSRCRRATIDPVVSALDATDTAADAAERLGMSAHRLVGFAGGHAEVARALLLQRERQRERCRAMRVKAQHRVCELFAEIRQDWHTWSAGEVGAKLRQLKAAMAMAKGKRDTADEAEGE